jgi:alginate O-acetyltransferase complex protein AlgI
VSDASAIAGILVAKPERRNRLLFTEPTFLFLFLPVLLLLYFASLTRTHGRYGNWLLMVASVIFYAKGGGTFTWLMLSSIAFNYWMAIAVDRRHGTAAARAMLAFALTANLVVLGIFKYANFFTDNVNTLFLALGVRPLVVPRVLLPIGISFFTFHAISYVVDVYRRDATAQKSPVHAALYLLLFPQLIAGPIIRYRDIADQLALRVVTLDDFAYGIRRFVIGLSKKVLVANVVAGPADKIFAMPFEQLSAAHAWLGIVCYTLQIYFDFSGYSDMAIGLGRMFGFRFPENFRWPYIARSIQEFWRRWHISLSTWFRDYLYIPLGGNRVPPATRYRNLVTVFFLCGLWHGASWNFVIWGLWHGVFLVAERLFRSSDDAAGAVRTSSIAAWPIWPHLYTLMVVMIGWVFFRAETLPGSIAFLEAMAGLSPAQPTPFSVAFYLTPELWLALAAGVIGSTPWVPAAAARLTVTADPRRVRLVQGLSTVSVLALFGASLLHVAARTYNPFIYFRF